MDVRELALELINILAEEDGYVGYAFISDKDFTPLKEYINIYRLKEIGNGNSIYVISPRPLDNEELRILNAVIDASDSEKALEVINDLLYKWCNKIDAVDDELYLNANNHAKVCYDLAVRFNLIADTKVRQGKGYANNKDIDAVRTTYTLINGVKIERIECRFENMFYCIWLIDMEGDSRE
jgi:hypothetical protein